MDKLSPEELARCFRASITLQKKKDTGIVEVKTSENERIEWIKRTALSMNDAIIQKCNEFDAKHPNDKFLASDCVNSTVTLLSWLLKATGRRIVNLEIGPITEPDQS